MQSSGSEHSPCFLDIAGENCSLESVTSFFVKRLRKRDVVAAAVSEDGAVSFVLNTNSVR